MISGLIAVFAALLALGPSLVPGAASVRGLLMSLAALPIALLSVRSQGNRYLRIVVAIVAVGALLINDGLRIWNASPMPTGLYVGLLMLTAAVIGACFVVARRLGGRAEHR